MLRPLIVLGSIVLIVSTHSHLAARESKTGTYWESLRKLEDGHARFVNGKTIHPRADLARVKETGTNGQKPWATILTCSDSRAPVEVIFDQGIGDLFVVRVAGNVADTDEIGTIEYGVGHLGTPLLLVLGHSKCGAVTAVVEKAKVGGSIPKLVDNIGPAVQSARKRNPGQTGAVLVHKAIEENVFQSMHDTIVKSEEIRHLIGANKLKVIGGVYNIVTGGVTWLGEHPDQASLVAGH